MTNVSLRNWPRWVTSLSTTRSEPLTGRTPPPQGIPLFIKTSAAGYLMKREVEYLEGAVENPVRPFVALLGGSEGSREKSA